VTWSEFGAGLAQSVIAGMIIAWVLYRIVDRRLKLKQDRVRRAEFVRGILEMLRLELAEDIGKVDVMKIHIPKDETPMPAFQTTCAGLILQAEVFTAFSPDTTQKLLFAYNRLESTNELHARLSESRFGMIAMVGSLAAKFFRGGGDEVLLHRRQLQEKLLDRCDEMVPYLEDALAAVNELEQLP
jgi:hypothetical protein